MDNLKLTNWFLLHIKETIEKNRDYHYKISDQSDRIIVWLVGFSVAGIVLMLNKDINSSISNIRNSTIVFASLTTIFGILYRIFLFLYQRLEIDLISSFESFIQRYINLAEFEFGREINIEHSIEDMKLFFKEDFNIKIEPEEFGIKFFPQGKVISDLVEISNLTKLMKKRYEEKRNFYTEANMKELKDILSSKLGFSKRKLNKAFNNDSNNFSKRAYWFFLRLSSIFFVLTCLIFISGIIFIMFNI